MSERVRDYYEEYWSDAGFYPKGETRPDVAQLFARYVKPSARVLDVGCGDGGTAGAWLQGQGADYVGVDISANAVRDARQRGLDARVIEDASVLPFQDAEFDVALCLDVFEHLFDPFAASFEIARILRPGGIVIAATPNAAYWRRRLELAVFGRFNPFGDNRSMKEPWRDPHLRFFTIYSLRRMLVATGFTVMATTGYSGGLIRDIPRVRGLGRGGRSRVYARLERLAPSLFGLAIACVAKKTSS